MTAPSSKDAAIIASIGAVRRRDLPRVAYLLANANSPITRSVPFTWVLVYPLWVLQAAAYRRSLALVNRRACLHLEDPNHQHRPELTLLLPIVLLLATGPAVATSMSWLNWIDWRVFLSWGFIAIAVLLPDVVCADRARRAKRLPRLRDAGRKNGDLLVTSVAAHPRGKNHGTALLTRATAALDAHHASAVLDARPDPSLITLYRAHGFREVLPSLHCYRLARRASRPPGGCPDDPNTGLYNELR